jgi:hypothetical protein
LDLNIPVRHLLLFAKHLFVAAIQALAIREPGWPILSDAVLAPGGAAPLSQRAWGAPPSTGWGDTNVADDDKQWQDMNPDEQAVVIRQINGAVNGLQFRVQDLEDAVKALQERLKR